MLHRRAGAEGPEVGSRRLGWPEKDGLVNVLDGCCVSDGCRKERSPERSSKVSITR